MGEIIKISITTFNNGRFEISFKDKETNEEISFLGNQSINDEELTFINKIAPACVWTTYERVTPEN
jgi:hypothetical protein